MVRQKNVSPLPAHAVRFRRPAVALTLRNEAPTELAPILGEGGQIDQPMVHKLDTIALASTALRRSHSEAEIVYRRDVAPDLWIIRVRVTPPLSFRPGQYATIGVASGARLVERPYSIVSSPAEPELEFFLELVPHGDLTPLLHKLREGDQLYVRNAARGRLALDTASGRRNHLMIATVTGVAPFVSIVRTALREQTRFGKRPRIFILHGASRSWELGYDQELSAIERSVDWLRYVATVSRPDEDCSWKGECGRVHQLISRYLDRFVCRAGETTVYLAGHPEMIAAGRKMLIERGFPPEAIHEEKYWTVRI